MARRRRKALGSTDRTHERLSRDYLRSAENYFKLAQETDDCHAVYSSLVRAQNNYARAWEHAVSTTQGEDGASATMRNVGQKIRNAITAFGKGPCLRRSPYDKG